MITISHRRLELIIGLDVTHKNQTKKKMYYRPYICLCFKGIQSTAKQCHKFWVKDLAMATPSSA